MLFGHGDDQYNAPGEVKSNFSSNVWHGADLTGVKEHLFARFDAITRYPEPDAGSLRGVLARSYGVGEDYMLVTNGSVTAFYLIAQAWRKRRSVVMYPAFAEYEDACRLHEHDITFIPTSRPLDSLPLERVDLCWICNPNNPDGKWWSRTDLLNLIGKYPYTTFVIDQAYAAFTRQGSLLPADIDSHPNMILIESVSKVYDIPGLRIGYLIASPRLIDKLSPYQIPWSVNAMAIEAATYLLENQYVLPIDKWLTDTDDFVCQLKEIREIEVHPSATTFFLVRLKQGRAADLKQFLLTRHSILIRDASNFRGLDDRFFRLSTQKPHENRLFLEALREWLDERH